MLIVVAPSSIAICTTSAVNSHVRARGVHRRELDVVQVLLGVRHRRARLPLDVLARGLQLVHDVDVRRSR